MRSTANWRGVPINFARLLHLGILVCNVGRSYVPLHGHHTEHVRLRSGELSAGPPQASRGGPYRTDSRYGCGVGLSRTTGPTLELKMRLAIAVRS